MLQFSNSTIVVPGLTAMSIKHGSVYDAMSFGTLRHLLMLSKSKVNKVSTASILAESIVVIRESSIARGSRTFQYSSTYSSIS